MQCYTGNCTNYHDCRYVSITIAISVGGGCQHHRVVKDSLKVVNLFLEMYGPNAMRVYANIFMLHLCKCVFYFITILDGLRSL